MYAYNTSVCRVPAGNPESVPEGTYVITTCWSYDQSTGQHGEALWQELVYLGR